MNGGWLGWYFRAVARRPRLVLGIVAALSLLSAFQISRGFFATSLIKSFLGDAPAFDRYRALRSRFDSGDLMAIAFEDPSLYTEPGWARLGRIEAALEELPFVDRVYSPRDAYRIQSSSTGVDLRPYRDVVKESRDYSALREEILANPDLVPTLVSQDGKCTMLLLELRPYDVQPVEAMPTALAGLIAPFVAEGFSPDQVHLAGLYAETVEGIAESRYSVVVLFPFTAIILLIAIYLLFGQLWPVLITGTVSLLGTAMTFAVAVTLDTEINLLMAMVPAVTMIISFSDVIHLCSRYQHLLGEGSGKEDAIVGAAEEVGNACVYNSVTNAAGFASMVLIPAPVFATVGVALTLGVLIALVLCMTLVPVLLAITPTPKAGPERKPTFADRLLDRIVLASGWMALRHPWLTIGGFFVTFLVAASFLAQLTFETSMVDRLSAGNRLQVARRFIQQHFGGTTFLEVFATVREGDALDPEVYREVLALQSGIAAIDGVDSVQSFTDIVERVHLVMDEGVAHSRTRASISQSLLLAESSGDDSLSRLLDDERRTVRSLARLRQSGIMNSAEIGRRIEAEAKARAPHLEVETSGLTKLFGDWVDELLEGQRRGLWLAIVTTTLTMAYCFGRLSTGVVSMVPNLYPIVVVGGVLVFLSPVQDSDLLLIAMIAVGTVVDDTVHLVSCMMVEAQKTTDLDRVIERSLALTGRSMIKATIVLCAGFMPFALSGYSTTRHMGTTLPLTLFMAAMSELLLTPALAKVGALRVRPKR